MSPTTKQALLNYLQFLKENGYLYMEGIAPEALAVKVAEAPAASSPAWQRSREAASRSGAPASARSTPLNSDATISAGRAGAPVKTAPAPPASQAAAVNLFAGPSLALEERQARLDEGRARAEACRECPLGAQRNKLVFFDGDPLAKIVFVGEAPGGEEDRLGLPFVGPAGQLLNKMIGAIGFKREEVFICNTIKCRPPGNRDPLPAEKAACEHFLLEQLAVLRPQVLVALGAHAAQYLCRSEEPIGRLRGRWHDYHGIPLLATYHPAFLLHNESKDPARAREFRAKCWEDFQRIHARYSQLNPGDPRQLWSKKENAS